MIPNRETLLITGSEHEHEKTAADVYVVPCDIAEHKETNKTTTHCVWIKGIDSLMPKQTKPTCLSRRRRTKAISVPVRRGKKWKSSWGICSNRRACTPNDTT